MRQVAIVFTTSGDKPTEGHRFRELLAAEVVDGAATGSRLHQKFRLGEELEGRSFSQQFGELDVFIGTSKVVVHDGGLWQRFMRVELPGIKSRDARRLVRDIEDVGRWAQQRFPKQRRDLASLGKRLGVVVSRGVAGLARDGELLVGIAARMATPAPETVSVGQPMVSEQPPAVVVEPVPVNTGHRTFMQRLMMCWQVMTERV